MLLALLVVWYHLTLCPSVISVSNRRGKNWPVVAWLEEQDAEAISDESLFAVAQYSRRCRMEETMEEGLRTYSELPRFVTKLP